jgi:hypothetical protein
VSDEPGERDEQAEADWQRKRRLAEVFGETLPESTGDDRDEPSESGKPGQGRESASDRWLKSQVPPHHGG